MPTLARNDFSRSCLCPESSFLFHERQSLLAAPWFPDCRALGAQKPLLLNSLCHFAPSWQCFCQCNSCKIFVRHALLYFGYVLRLLRGTTLQLLRSTIVWSTVLRGIFWDISEVLTKTFTITSSASSLDYVLLRMPCIWSLLENHLWVVTSCVIWKGWDFSNPVIPASLFVFPLAYPLLFYFTISNKKPGGPFNILSGNLFSYITQFMRYIFYFLHYCRRQCCQNPASTWQWFPLHRFPVTSPPHPRHPVASSEVIGLPRTDPLKLFRLLLTFSSKSCQLVPISQF